MIVVVQIKGYPRVLTGFDMLHHFRSGVTARPHKTVFAIKALDVFIATRAIRYVSFSMVSE